MNPILSRTTTNVLFFFCLGLETSCCSTTERPSFQRLDHQIFLRSLQYGIVVMGVIDAFVYAHNDHRRNMVNLGNFGDCMKGRIRFMIAITPACAHAYQLICLTGHIPACSTLKNTSASCQTQISASSQRSYKTRERGNDFRGWSIYTDGGTRFADGETLVGLGFCRTISPWKDICHVWLSYHDRSSLCIRRCQGPLQQYR